MPLLRVCMVLALSVAGCSDPYIAKARLYNFNTGTLGTAQIFGLDQQFGRITAELADGEKLQGEFTLTHEPTAIPPSIVNLSLEELALAEDDIGTHDSSPEDNPTLASFFGYDKDAEARPVGTATLVGGRGTVLDIVFYALDTQLGEGSGVGRDNKGNWYLIRSGI